VLDYETKAAWIHQKPDRDMRMCGGAHFRSPRPIIAPGRSQTGAAIHPFFISA